MAGIDLRSSTSQSGAYMPSSATWQPNTAYKAGQLVYNGGLLYAAVADFTSGASFSAVNWTQVGTPFIAAPDAALLPPQPQRTIVQSFQSGHTWGAGGASGATDLNNTDAAAQLMGTQAVKVTTGGTGVTRSLFKTGLTAMDLTNKQLSLLVTVVDPTHLKEISVQAGDGAFTNWSKFYAQSSTSAATGEVNVAGQPVWLDIPYLVNGTGGAGITRTAVTALQVNIGDDNTGNAVVVYIHAVALRPIPTPWSTLGVGCLSISLDDGYATHYTAAMAKLAQNGFAANIYPICDSIDSANHVTTAQLQTMQNVFGCSVQAHSYLTTSHTSGYAAMSDADAIADMTANQKWLADRGLTGGDFLAWPQGQFHGTALDNARRMFVAARTTNNRVQNTLPLSLPHRMRAFTVQSTDTTATLTAQIDRAKASNSHLELVFHELVTSGATGFQYTIANFNTVMDYALTAGVPVKTLPQLLATR